MNNHSPKLSVIVANYNNEEYLPECLDSVLNQTYQDFEILICDDCSTDHSLSILESYQQLHPSTVRVISNTTNQGVTKTRHLAILQAKGEYITTLDSDDYYYDKQKLEREMQLVFQHKKTTGKDILAFSDIALIKGDRTLIAIMGESKTISEGHIINELMCRSSMIPRDFIIKKDIYFEVGGFDAAIPIYEDWDLKIRLASKYDFYYSNVNGTAYRRHGDGLSSAPVSEHVEWLKKIFDKNLVLIADNDRDYVRGRFRQFLKQHEEDS